MSHANPYRSPKAVEKRPRRPRTAPPGSLLGSVRQGVRLGIKWTTIIVGPVALLCLLVSVLMILFRFCFGEGMALVADAKLRWETLGLLASPFGLYLVFCMWGIVAGVVLCPLVYLVRRMGGVRRE